MNFLAQNYQTSNVQQHLYPNVSPDLSHSRKVLPVGDSLPMNPAMMSSRATNQASVVVPSKGSLFVGDISFFCTEADLVRLFEPYGRVLHVEVRRNAAGESLRHGFAELANVDAAQRAINELHSSKYMGRRIRVHWACVHVDKRQPRDRSSWTQIYVSFCALKRERIVSESLLDEVFSHFGPVADATVKKHSLVAPAATNNSSAYLNSNNTNNSMIMMQNNYGSYNNNNGYNHGYNNMMSMHSGSSSASSPHSLTQSQSLLSSSSSASSPTNASMNSATHPNGSSININGNINGPSLSINGPSLHLNGNSPMMMPTTPVWTGYAFVYFYDKQDAERATQALHSFEGDDLRLACSLSLRASLDHNNNHNNSHHTINNSNYHSNSNNSHNMNNNMKQFEYDHKPALYPALRPQMSSQMLGNNKNSNNNSNPGHQLLNRPATLALQQLHLQQPPYSTVTTNSNINNMNNNSMNTSMNMSTSASYPYPQQKVHHNYGNDTNNTISQHSNHKNLLYSNSNNNNNSQISNNSNINMKNNYNNNNNSFVDNNINTMMNDMNINNNNVVTNNHSNSDSMLNLNGFSSNQSFPSDAVLFAPFTPGFWATLFVGDLSYFCDENHLSNLFSQFGRVLHIELKRGKFGDSLMHAFLDFEHVESARRAIQELHDMKFMGRIMRVNWASAQAAKENARPREQWAQVHVAFSTPRVEVFVTEEVLEELFGRFGAIADITVKRHSRTVEPASHTGYAFLYYYERRAAIAAVQRFEAPIVVQGVRLQCTLTSKPTSTSPSITAISSPATATLPIPSQANNNSNANSDHTMFHVERAGMSSMYRNSPSMPQMMTTTSRPPLPPSNNTSSPSQGHGNSSHHVHFQTHAFDQYRGSETTDRSPPVSLHLLHPLSQHHLNRQSQNNPSHHNSTGAKHQSNNYGNSSSNSSSNNNSGYWSPFSSHASSHGSSPADASLLTSSNNQMLFTTATMNSNHPLSEQQRNNNDRQDPMSGCGCEANFSLFPTNLHSQTSFTPQTSTSTFTNTGQPETMLWEDWQSISGSSSFYASNSQHLPQSMSHSLSRSLSEHASAAGPLSISSRSDSFMQVCGNNRDNKSGIGYDTSSSVSSAYAQHRDRQPQEYEDQWDRQLFLSSSGNTPHFSSSFSQLFGI